jgi:hypothetical protein
MFCMITNIYNNKKTKGPTLMEFFTATVKLKKFFWQIEMFDVCTTGDTVQIDYDIQVLATHASTWVHRYSSLLQRSVPLGQRGRCIIGTEGRNYRWNLANNQVIHLNC